MKLLVPACRAAALSLAAMFGATGSAAQGLNHPNSLDDPPTLVAHFPHYGDSAISDIRLRGSVRNIDYSIAAARTDAHIIFDISLAGRSVQLRLRKEDFPDIDLRTIREGVSDEFEPLALRFGVEYGELGGCSDSVETPRRLSIFFNVEGRISASRLSAQGCHVVWHQLSLEQTAPNFYSATVQD